MFGETWSHGTLVKSLGNVHPLSSPCSTRRFQPLQAPSRQLSQFKCGSFRTSGWFITACHSTAFMLHTSSLPRIRFLYNPSLFPRGKVPEKGCSPVLQVQPHNVTLGYLQGTRFSPSRQDCSTPSLSSWVSGDIPAFSHSYFPWSVHVRTFCLFPRVPV